MSAEGSVTRWLELLQSGDRDAAHHLWGRYFRRLVGLARLKLNGMRRRAADEEDVALSAFDSFCRNAEGGRFPQLQDRDSLWRLLVVITARKAAHLARDEMRQKRGGNAGRIAEPASQDRDDDDCLIDQVISREPTPEIAAQLTEEYQHLLGTLADPELEAIALARMEGYSVEEIARQRGLAGRSIKRKLQLIRSIWEQEVRP
jgi:DNA-directed RNA polymerase specialized sigma24 family protein